jgi:Glycosyl transferase family 2
LSSVEMRQKSVRLGSSHVAVTYPRSLDLWFDGLVEPADETIAPRKWVRLCAHEVPGRFDVHASVNPPAAGLDLGDALATFWERVSFLLVDDLRDAIALHAAALCQKNCLVLLPGRSGSGKTRLSLWYRAQGFDLCTDEIVTASPGPNGISDLVLDGALARPVILKALVDANGLLRPGETPVAQQDSSCGLLLRPEVGAPWTQRAIDRGIIVFPRFTLGAPFNLTALTPGEACLRLIENCLNARNLPRGGLPFASLLARRIQAVALDYGETGQLHGTLDVLTRQMLATPITPDDLVALCAAFTARAATRTPSVAKSDATAHTSLDAPRCVAPAPTVARFPRRLTIGMATYDDYDGVYFTVQSIRINNPELDGGVEFVVIDNNPGGPCSEALIDLDKWIDGYRYVPRSEWTGTAIRNAVFEEASSQIVLCIDSHVLVVPGALSKLIAYFEADPDSCDLVQGPLVYDDLRQSSTHMERQWRGGMYGIWANDPRGADPSAPCFDIPMQGLGLFACRRATWPGFNPKFRGFGGEEGYIHEKIRQRGGRTLCLPFLRWAHRFSRPLGAPYVNRWEDRIRNYVIGFTELGLDTAEMEAHFAELLGAETSAKIFTEIKMELGIL